MSRGMLDKADWEKISQKIPDLENLRGMALNFAPDFLSMNFKPESTVPEASVCLNDALRTLGGAVYALSEVFAHQAWYMEKKDPPNEMTAVFFGRFYADDAALRLYSSGEHLANGIIMMLEIKKRELKDYTQRGKCRLQVIGDFLEAKKVNTPVTEAVDKLAYLKEWCDTINYRNRWVHEQPPTVKGLGIVYKRKKNETRWKPLPTGKGYTLGVGGGDVPEYSIEELIGFIQPAMFQFVNTLTSIVNFYMKLLEDFGSVRFNLPTRGE